MSTLGEPIWSEYSIELTQPPGRISSTHLARKDGARVGMKLPLMKGRRTMKKRRRA